MAKITKTKTTVKKTTQDKKKYEIALEEIIKTIKKGPPALKAAGITSNTFRDVLNQYPIHYMQLTTIQKEHLDNIIALREESLRQKEHAKTRQGLEEFKKVKAGDEGVKFRTLRTLKEDLNKTLPESERIGELGHTNLTNAGIWYRLLEQNLPGLDDGTRELIHKSKLVLDSLDAIQPTDYKILNMLGAQSQTKTSKAANVLEYVKFLNQKPNYIEHNLEYENIQTEGLASTKLHITSQSPAFNKLTGSAAKHIGDVIQGYNAKFTTALGKHILGKTNNFPNITSSFGILRYVDELISNLISGKKTKKVNTKKRKSSREKIGVLPRLKKAIARFNKAKIREPSPPPPEEELDFLGLIALINQSLAQRGRGFDGKKQGPTC